MPVTRPRILRFAFTEGGRKSVNTSRDPTTIGSAGVTVVCESHRILKRKNSLYGADGASVQGTGRS